MDPLLASLLDRGEAATIALALQESAALVLMDEVKGRRVARDVYGLAVIGTGRIMAGLISFSPVKKKLRVADGDAACAPARGVTGMSHPVCCGPFSHS